MYSFNMFALFEMTLGNFMKCFTKKLFNTKRAAEAALLDVIDILATATRHVDDVACPFPNLHQP